MAMNRTGIPTLMGFQEGGDMQSALKDYEAQYRKIEKPAFDPEKLKERVSSFADLMPQQKQNDIYELISAIGKGLLAQQTEKLPSIGRGFAYGLEIYDQANKKKQAEAKKISDTLFNLAVKDYEAERNEEVAFRKDLLEKNYEIILQRMKNEGGFFKGTNPLAQAFNYLLQAEKDPTKKYEPDGKTLTADYKLAKAFVEQPQVQYVQSETGTVPVTRPGFNLDGVFGDTKKMKVNVEIGGMFPVAPYLTYQLQADGITFIDTANNKQYTYNNETQKMEPR